MHEEANKEYEKKEPLLVAEFDKLEKQLRKSPNDKLIVFKGRYIADYLGLLGSQELTLHGIYLLTLELEQLKNAIEKKPNTKLDAEIEASVKEFRHRVAGIFNQLFSQKGHEAMYGAT